MVIEITFPRGGKKPPTNSVQTIKHDVGLFGDERKKPKQKSKEQKIREIEKTVIESDITATSAELLSYRSLQDGMVLFGCIQEVQKMTLVVSLPGKIYGRVMITNISPQYTQVLHSIVDNNEPEGYKSLRQLFTLGQCVAVRIVKIDSNDDKYRVGLSMFPDEINSQLFHTAITTGMLLWGAISSCEEHGYVVDLGIKNCRAFLQKSNVDEGKEYVVGEVLWSVVQKSDVTPTATTVALNALKNKVENTKVIKDVSLDHMVAGMQVDFTITKILSNGLEGTFLNNFIGYIHEGQLPSRMDQLHSYQINQDIQARIMYIMPITKLSFLTMRDLEPEDKGSLQNGTIMTCKVLNRTRGGLYLHLNKSNRGFVSYRRLKTDVTLASEEDEINFVRKYYPHGSKHHCRILSYDYLDRVYICSLEKELLATQIFSLKDLKCGETVTAVVREIQDNGLLVEVGRLNGFIKNEHLSDTVFTSQANLKSKFHIGQKLKAKVWIINEENNVFYLTVKPSLLTTEENLTSFEEAENNKQFPGIIKQVSNNGLLVQFFGDVYGWVPKSQMSFERVDYPADLFKPQQLVKCTIINSNPNTRKITLSLLPPRTKSQKKQLAIGEHVSATVSSITQTGIEVVVNNSGGLNAVIPLLHLTKFTSLATTIAGFYKEGDEIPDLVCISREGGVPTLSIRELDLNEQNIPKYSDLKLGDILSCSIQTVKKRAIYLQSPIKDFKKSITIPIENVTDDGNIEGIDIKKNQPILARIQKINRNSQKIIASTQLNVIWQSNFIETIQLLSDYLKAVQIIKDKAFASNNPLACLKLGERVTGIVKQKIEGDSYIVQLSNGAFAHVLPEHRKGELTIGSEVKGAVLWLNFERDYAEISVYAKITNRINPIQKGQIKVPIDQTNGKINFRADILLVKEDFILVTIRNKFTNRQLVFIPTRCHINDLKPNINDYSIGDQLKVGIISTDNGVIIGVFKEVVKSVVDEAKKDLKRSRTKSIPPALENEPKTKKPRLDATITKVKKPKKKQKPESEIQIILSPDDLKPNQRIKAEKLSNTMKRKLEQQLIPTEDTELNPEKKIKEQTLKIIEPPINVDEIKSLPFTIDVEPALPGASDFWNIPEPEVIKDESSDDDDEEQNEATKLQKKKKLTPAERAEAARIEEERIRKIETELANTDTAPKTADQFDRLVLANPNNSLYWINYMAFHLEAIEIEKARAVARQAISTIEFRQEQEKLNVWFAYLNLENRYGTQETFDSVLEEAVKMNDSLTVYTQALNILSDSKKTQEFNELLTRVTKKFKQDFNMWVNTAEACYKCELKDQARNLMQRALKSLEEKQHINLLVQFALMESRFNEPERAEALLEKVLASYPRRVDVWTSYVDMLIKGNRIHIARNVLERAVGQKLPARKMKTIFTKYVQFESKYGDAESVVKVRQMAAEYVKTALQ